MRGVATRCAVSLAFAIACTTGPDETTTTGVTPPTIEAFVAAPAVVLPGADATLSWRVTGASKVSITPGVGEVVGTNTVVHPAETTVYTLTATNDGGSATATVTVSMLGPPRISSFTANPSGSVGPVQVTLAWTVAGADAILLNGQPMTETSASYLVTATTTYTLTATNAAGNARATTTVSIVPWPTKTPPIPQSFTATPATIPAGGTST